MCPITRKEVSDSTFRELATRLMEDPSLSSSLAAELLVDLRSRGQEPSSSVTEEATIEALRAAVKRGDAAKVPSMAALLGRGGGPQAQSMQPVAVRLAAVDALRSMVPNFPDGWVGHAPVLSLLRGVATSDADDEVRCAAMRCLGEVGRKGEEATFLVVRCALEDSRASSDLRDAAANALQALSVRGDIASMRLALVAMKDKDYSVRTVGYSTLKQVCGPEGGCPDFLGDLADVVTSHPDGELRVFCLEMVGQLEANGGVLGTGIAAMAMQDRDEEVAHLALMVFRRLCPFGDLDGVDALVAVAAARGRPERIRSAALDVLAQLAKPGDHTACLGAAALLTDEESSVSHAACNALKKLAARGDVEVVSQMLSLLQHDDCEVRRMAAEVLGKAAHPQDTEVSRALEALARSGDFEASMAAENALGQLR